MALYDRVWFSTATTGTGTITVGSAITGFRTPATASIPNAATFGYVILDGAAWEIGTGTYTSAGTTVARSLISSSTGSLLNLSGSASMFVTAVASKTPQIDVANTWAAAQTFSAIPVLDGGGVKFPAAQVASADVNTLDDYEEGTFTPALTFGGAAVGMTFSQQNGRYTKIGNLVTAGILLSFTAKGSSTGTAVISGLPFTASATIIQGCGAMYATALTSVAMPMCRIVQGTAVVDLYDFQAGTVAVLTDGDFQNGSQIGITISYWV